MTKHLAAHNRSERPLSVLDALRSGSKPGEPMITTVERAVREYRSGKRKDKAASRVAQIAGVLNAYLVRVSDTTAIAWALALLGTPGRTLQEEEMRGHDIGSLAPSFQGMPADVLAVEILTASFRDWSAAEVERVVSGYAKALTGDAWPELSPIEAGLRSQRERFVDRVRQALGANQKALASSSEAHPDDAARMRAAREAARSEMERAAGRSVRSVQDAISGLSDARGVPRAFVPHQGARLRTPTKAEIDKAEARRRVLREQAAEIEGGAR